MYQQGLSLLLDAVVQNDSSVLSMHLDNLLSVIFPLVSQTPCRYRQQTVVYVGTFIDNNITAHVGNLCNMLPNLWHHQSLVSFAHYCPLSFHQCLMIRESTRIVKIQLTQFAAMLVMISPH